MCEMINRLGAYRKVDAIKVLFAEDFVNHILVHFELPCLSSMFGVSRPLIYNAFNPTVKTATDILYRRLEKINWRHYKKIYRQGPLKRDAFMHYARSMRLECYSKSFHTGFNAKKFLHFCVKISVMAARFVLHRIYEGPVLAVQCILSLLKKYDMNTTLWDNVNLTAFTYNEVYSLDSVSETESESGTDSELPNSSENDPPKASCSRNVSVQERDKGDRKNGGEEETLDSAMEFQASNSLEGKLSEASCSSLFEPPYCSKASCLLNWHPQASISEDEAVQMSGSAEFGLVFVSDEEYESEVFKVGFNTKRFNCFEGQSVKKQSLSFNSSQQSYTSLTCLTASASGKVSNMSSSDSDCNTLTSKFKEFRIRKHVRKARRK